jgi:hypothetical protein
LDVVDYVFRDDPNFVRPLDFDLKQRLSKKNPFFEHAEATTFTAYKNGWCVGRASAQIDRGHLERYKDDVGFFGFLDTVDDPEVSKALLDASAKWLSRRGMKKMRGPLSLNINEEMGSAKRMRMTIACGVRRGHSWRRGGTPRPCRCGER